MAHFNNFNHHWRRGHRPAVHRDDVVPSDTPSPTDTPVTPTTPASLIIPVAPTIIGDPFATTSTPSLSPSPSPIETPTTTSPAPAPSLTPSSSPSPSLTPTTTSTTSTTSSPSPVLSTPSTTSITSLTSSTPTPTFIRSSVNQPSVVSTPTVSPSPTNTPAPVGGTSTGIIAGGIIAAILGSAGVLAAVVYFLRKCRGRQDEALAEEIWNRGDARRQSAILGDESEPVRPFVAPGRGSPRPPSMIERRMNNTAYVPPRQPTLPNMHPNNAYGNGYGATNYSQNSFSPGQIVSPNSANPFFSPYAQDVMVSPVSSTVPEYHDPPHYSSPAPPPQALMREPSVGVGQATVAHQNSVTGGPFSPVVSSPDAADPHYTDLSRSSVTPFQAAQYAEITEKLGAPMSSVLVAVPEEQQAVASDNMAGPSRDDPTQGGNTHTESPFADVAVVQEPIDNPSHEPDDELPPPSPYSFQQTRIPSLPPTLPEIAVPERSFSPVASLEFPVPLSVRNSPSPLSAEFSDLRGPHTEPNYQSSPLATSTPMQAQAQATVIPREPRTEGAPAPRPDTVYTVYDEEDAYGGI